MVRSTKQRAAIIEAIKKAGRPLMPQEILEAARTEVPVLGIATVYRNLKLLLEANELKRVELPGDTPRYELVQHGHAHHHHHFLCTKCERAFDIYGCSEDFIKMAPSGFTVHSHDITLYGFCNGCMTSAGKKKVHHKSSNQKGG